MPANLGSMVPTSLYLGDNPPEQRVAVTLRGQRLAVEIRRDPDVGFHASCRQTPLWFGYGDTPEKALESYLGVAEAALAFMDETGRPFEPLP